MFVLRKNRQVDEPKRERKSLPPLELGHETRVREPRPGAIGHGLAPPEHLADLQVAGRGPFWPAADRRPVVLGGEARRLRA